ncbi:Na+/proline symporter [Halovivax ruber XH-70]|uniref:Na+/proline symporter n=1 Tax=Halovivax ruber (strain DSM 18193 / JCM 13892 / XH-70) TaxID=797302 RepID=L0I9J9_HALRX|nr:sodium:solute symporter family protein [Halovivax ruber]AGB15498.1 Na+/proline symporter [Halovivax ruber XH-70]
MTASIAQVTFAGYLALMLVIGVYAGRFTERTPADFYVAGRTVGPLALALTLVATVLSAFTVFGIGAQTVGTGLGAFSFLGLAAVFYTFVFASVGVTLYRIGRQRDVLTPAEYIRERYESPTLGIVYLAVTGIFMIAMLAGQLIGGGVALDTLVDIPYTAAILVMAAFMIVYVHLAGYRGVVWSDVVQSTVLFVVLAGVVGYVMIGLDSASIAAEAATVEPSLFTLPGPKGTWTPLAIATAALAFTVGVPGYPHTIQRYFSAADETTLRRSGVLFALVAIPIYLFGTLLGAWALGVVSVPDPSDHVIPVFIESISHPVVFGIAMAAATAAIMSTADSVALTMSSMLSRDVYRVVVDPAASDEREVVMTQAFLIATVVLSVLLALAQPAGIFDLIAFAVVGFATTTAPVFLGAYWRGATVAGGVASLVLGPGVTILFFLEVIPPTYTFGMHYGFVGVLVAYGIFVGVSLLTSAPDAHSISAYSRSIVLDRE